MVFDNIYADTNAVLKNAPIAQSVLDHIKVKIIWTLEDLN